MITRWGSPGEGGGGQFSDPIGSPAVASDGSVYVSDTVSHQIQKFTSDGVFIIKWGNDSCPSRRFWCAGSGNGEFEDPSGVAVASDGSVYVADAYNHRIQKFTVWP